MSNNQWDELLEIQRQILAELKESRRRDYLEDQSTWYAVLRARFIVDIYRAFLAFVVGFLMEAFGSDSKHIVNWLILIVFIYIVFQKRIHTFILGDTQQNP